MYGLKGGVPKGIGICVKIFMVYILYVVCL